MYNRAVKNSKGFTLIELMVSIFVFSLVMTSATAVFAKVFRARQKSNAIQKNIEDTRYAMELMAKSLRMSSIISSTSPSQANGSILSYDYSQGKCIRYWTSNGFLYMSSKISDFSSCSTSGLSTNIMTTGRITGFRIRSITSDYTSGSKRAGKVTISIKICTADGTSSCGSEETIQTTVSLRDYGYIMNQ